MRSRKMVRAYVLPGHRKVELMHFQIRLVFGLMDGGTDILMSCFGIDDFSLQNPT